MNLPPLPASLWRDGFKDLAYERPPLGDQRYDVAIIGGGYCGLHAALVLVEAGLKVALFEAGGLGLGGSGRNGGVVTAKFRRGFADMAGRYGLDMARRMHEIANESVTHLLKTLDRYELKNTGMAMTGALKCAHSARAFDHARREADWLGETFRQTGLAVLDASEVAAETGVSCFVGGVLQKNAGTIQPLSYLAGLWQTAKDQGVHLFVKTPVTKITEERNWVRLVTPFGAVAADRLFLATNAYSRLLPGGQKLAQSLVPFRSAMIATQRLSEELDQRLLRHERSYTETRRMMRWFRKVDGRILFGGRGALGQVDSPAAYQRLHQALKTIMPDLREVPIAYCWSGQVALTHSGLPHAGFLSDRIAYAAGYNGAGIAMSGLVGARMADRLLGKTSDLGLIEQERLPIVPLHPLRALGVRSLTAGYEMLDRLGF